MRFFCEWCHEKVLVVNSDAPYGEVLSHLSDCAYRSSGMTLKQTAGLANHIAQIIVEQDGFRCPTCGNTISVKIDSWWAIQRQILDHVHLCAKAREAR